MKNNRIIALIFTSFFILGGQVMLAQGHKVGYTNFNYLYDQTPEKPFIDLVLKSIKTEHDSVMNAKVKVFQEKYKSYEEMAKKPTNELIVKELERELQAMQKNAQEFQQSSNAAILEKERTLAGPIKGKILKAIQDVAKEKGYHYILNSYLEEVNLAVFLQATEKDNITPDVLKKLDITPAEKPAKPTPAIPVKKK